MTQDEYMELLRYYFRRVPDEEKQEILADYEDYFWDGRRDGKTDDDISRELGSPREVYESFRGEGVLDEKKRMTFSEGAGKLMDGAGRTYAAVKPRLPGAARTVSDILLRTFSLLCYAGAVVIWCITAAVLYVLSIEWQPFDTVAALPGLHPLTFWMLLFAGAFAGLALFFGAMESGRWQKKRVMPERNGGDPS